MWDTLSPGEREEGQRGDRVRGFFPAVAVRPLGGASHRKASEAVKFSILEIFALYF